MSGEKPRPRYMDPESFEMVPFDEDTVKYIRAYEPAVAGIKRMIYRGATLLLSDQKKERISSLDAAISMSWPYDRLSSSPRLNISGAQYLLEFAVLSPDDLWFLLHTYARQQGLHCYIGDELSDAFFVLHQKGEISLVAFRFFIPCFRRLDFLGGFLAQLESENPMVLDSVEKKVEFTKIALAELKANKAELFEKWKLPQWENKRNQEGIMDEEKDCSYYDFALMSLELALTRIEKKSRPYGDQDDNYLYHLPGDGQKFDFEEWGPDQIDLDLPDDWGTGAA